MVGFEAIKEQIFSEQAGKPYEQIKDADRVRASHQLSLNLLVVDDNGKFEPFSYTAAVCNGYT